MDHENTSKMKLGCIDDTLFNRYFDTTQNMAGENIILQWI